ncbi:hypothetical protein MANES_08G055200v8 [Manihot esculenta]|uniref:PGG domain-containing protein n=2 Tax=Manihot esculenta TaxID=3983 RepID=A0A2C9VDM5_MANES|nr:hypothetical protein MANES_08G055200v8 [Manihot esculenta]OAY43262.1 hypothetical protein MANES_08G055200v8 [Manihot esculenta]
MALRLSSETKDTILKVLGISNASSLTLVSLLPSSSSAEAHQFHAGEILSGHLPLNFYILTFATNNIIVCTGAIAVLMWSIPCRPILVYTLISVVALYGLLMLKIMPKFVVGVLGIEFSSYALVWSLALTFISAAFVGYHFVKYACLGLSKLGTWVVAKLKLDTAWIYVCSTQQTLAADMHSFLLAVSRWVHDG